jgi:nitrogen regulatory protein PII
MNDENNVLIVTIVKKGWGDTVVQASKNAGAQGGTVVFGRGTGIHEDQTFMGFIVEPEKEIVLIIVPSSISEKVYNKIIDAVNLEKPGNGMGFILPVDRVFGIPHMYASKNNE